MALDKALAINYLEILLSNKSRLAMKLINNFVPHFLLWVIILVNYSTAFADNQVFKRRAPAFVENKGQWPSEVLFLARINGLDAWITKNGATYDLYTIKSKNSLGRLTPTRLSERLLKHEYQRYGHIVKVNLVGANEHPIPKAEQISQVYYNYFVGNDPKRWRSYVASYRSIVIENIYQGIDQRYYFDKGYIRYDYIVHPGAVLSQLQLEIEGAYSSWIGEKGELVFSTAFGNVKHQDIYAYQIIEGKKIKVEARWQQNDNTFTLKLNKYNPNYDVIIDPLLYSTFIGGSGIDEGADIAIDSDGNAYIVGITESSDYPTTTGVYINSLGGYIDACITKLNSDGSNIVFSTFLGGGNLDGGLSIAIDGNRNIFVTGFTKSANFPSTANAYQKSIASKDTEDVFVAKLNNDGSSLIYSTFIGGTNLDIGKAIAIGPDGNAYVTGYTTSANFPATPNAFDRKGGGGFVVKLNNDGSDLIYSTFLRGGELDDISVDSKGYAYVAGVTFSETFPTTSGAFNVKHNGYFMNFVTKLNQDGSGLVYSTFLGGNNPDGHISIAVDSNNNAYVCGTTTSVYYPTTEGAYDRKNEGPFEIFVTKLNPEGSNLLYSTFIGGKDSEFGWGLALDKRGNAYITGSVLFIDTIDFPITECSYKRSYGGAFDALVAVLNSTGSDLLYSTFIGGNGLTNEYGLGIATDSVGNAYLTGDAWSSDFPVSTDAFDTTYNGNYDAFALKLNLCCPMNPSVDVVKGNPVICKGDTVILKANPDNPNFAYRWSNGDNKDTTIVTDGGYHFVEITNEIGCSEVAGINIGLKPTVDVTIDTIYAKVGSTEVSLNIRCRILGAGNKTITDLSFRIGLDASSFLPATNQDFIEQNYVDNDGIRHLVLHFRGLNLKNRDTITFQLLGTALLGNNRTNPIELFEVSSLDTVLCSAQSSGRMILDSICVFELRKVEIFTPSNFEINPNPANTHEIEISFEGEEQGIHSLNIYNVDGVLLDSRQWNNSGNSKRAFNFDLTEYPNGFYYVVLKTQWNAVAKPLLIMK